MRLFRAAARIRVSPPDAGADLALLPIVTRAFNGEWVLPLLGLILLPYTTLAYVLVFWFTGYQPVTGGLRGAGNCSSTGCLRGGGAESMRRGSEQLLTITHHICTGGTMADSDPRRDDIKRLIDHLRVKPGSGSPPAARLRPRLQAGEPRQARGARTAGQRCRHPRRVPRPAVRAGHVLGAAGAAGDGRRRQGRHHQARDERRQPAGRQRALLQEPSTEGNSIMSSYGAVSRRCRRRA